MASTVDAHCTYLVHPEMSETTMGPVATAINEIVKPYRIRGEPLEPVISHAAFSPPLHGSIAALYEWKHITVAPERRSIDIYYDTAEDDITLHLYDSVFAPWGVPRHRPQTVHKKCIQINISDPDAFERLEKILTWLRGCPVDL